MIPDVIESRRIAEKIKAEQLAMGKKVSAHNLWAEEFKKLHPTSTFTSNNLSVHLWTWKKQQQKLHNSNNKKQSKSAVNPGSSGSSDVSVVAQISVANKKPMTTSNGTFKDVQARDVLLEIGRKVEQMLQNSQTPNELKLKGFANVLHEEWTKAHPGSTETSRSLNMMYSRLIRQDADQAETASQTIFATWTPKHHGVLKTCMDDYPRKETEFETEYKHRIIKSWRSKFPKSSVSDENLLRRIHDLIYNKDSDDIPVGVTGPNAWSERYTTNSKKSNGGKKSSKDILEDLDSQRRPNGRGQMNWNKVAINDLLQCHNSANAEHKLILSNGKKPMTKLSELVHQKFLTLHPYCKLTPAILMTKCYSWRSAIDKGALNIDLASISPKIESQESMEAENMKPGTVKRSLSRDLVFRTWTQEMINDMLKTRKIALNRKRQQESFSKEPANLTDLWYEEFLKLYPDYKSSKKNLWRKYKWYKSRMGSTSNLEEQPMDVEEQQPVQPILRMKNIRKDVFSYLKAVLEEARIFLPMKLPDEPSTPTPPSSSVVTETTFTASQTLANFQHQAIMSLEPVPIEPMEIMTATSQPPIEILTAQPPIEILEPVNIQPVESQSQAEPCTEQQIGNDPSIKLPGGATLVAVTDRNADVLLKPKQLEKPHVTITIGDRPVEQPMMTAIMQTPTAQIPLSIPFPPAAQPGIVLPTVPTPMPQTVNLNLVQPPPLAQLKPYLPPASPAPPEPTSFLPLRIKSRLEELSLSESMFQELLQIYEVVREEYIELLKRGFLIFFPYLLGTRWREKYSTSSLTGRKLTTLIDMYVEEKRRGRITSPEYLTKVPCGFEVTELVLKQILVCYAETKRNHMGVKNEDLESLDLDTASTIYSQMIARWQKIHPEIKLTPKQIISIHHMLNFEPGKDEPSPEIVCYLTESLRKMDKEVPEQRREFVQFEPEPSFDESGDEDDDNTVEYDESNLSMEQLQELILATQCLEKPKFIPRPRVVAKKMKLFWTDEKVQDLFLAAEIALQKFKMNKKISIGTQLCRAWYKLNPGMTEVKVSHKQILARYKYQVRQDKRKATLESDKVIKSWEKMCENYRISEENIEVIDETAAAIESSKVKNETYEDSPLKLEYNSDLQSRDYNR